AVVAARRLALHGGAVHRGYALRASGRRGGGAAACGRGRARARARARARGRASAGAAPCPGAAGDGLLREGAPERQRRRDREEEQQDPYLVVAILHLIISLVTTGWSPPRLRGWVPRTPSQAGRHSSPVPGVAAEEHRRASPRR